MEDEKSIVSYSVDEQGSLHIFCGEASLADVSDCGHLDEASLNTLVEETLDGMGYVCNPDGTLAEKATDDLID